MSPANSGGSQNTGRSSGSDSWTEYRRLVLHEIERLSSAADTLTTELGNLATRVNNIQARIAAWTVIAAFVGTMVANVIIRFVLAKLGAGS